MQFSWLSALLKNLIHSDKFLRFSSNYQLWKLKKVRLVQFNWRKQGGEVHIVNMRQLEMKTSLRAKLFIIIVQVYESECDDQKNFLAAWGLLKTNFFHGVKIKPYVTWSVDCMWGLTYHVAFSLRRSTLLSSTATKVFVQKGITSFFKWMYVARIWTFHSTLILIENESQSRGCWGFS